LTDVVGHNESTLSCFLPSVGSC